MSNLIAIPRDTLEYLLKRDAEYTALENGGVDNWDYCYESFRDYIKQYEQEHEIELDDDGEFDQIAERTVDSYIKSGKYLEIPEYTKIENKIVDDVLFIRWEDKFPIDTISHFFEDVQKMMPNKIVIAAPDNVNFISQDKQAAISLLEKELNRLKDIN